MGWRPLQGTYLSTHLWTEFFPSSIVLRVAQYHLTEFVLTNCAEQIHPQQRQQHRCDPWLLCRKNRLIPMRQCVRGGGDGDGGASKWHRVLYKSTEQI